MEKIRLNILGLSCGDRLGGNTAWMVQYSLKVIEKFGRRIGEVADIVTEFIDVADKEIGVGLIRDELWEMPPSVQSVGPRDDYFSVHIEPKVIEADGFIFGSSVHNASFSSKFKLIAERFYPLVWKGHLTNKPAATIAVGYGDQWGLESCLHDMNNCLKALEMIVCTRLTGCPVSTGRTPEGENGKGAAAKKDRYGQWLASNQARRVAEVALKEKVAKRRLGEIYSKEFIQVYHPLYMNQEEPWSWWRIDEDEEERMMRL